MGSLAKVLAISLFFSTQADSTKILTITDEDSRQIEIELSSLKIKDSLVRGKIFSEIQTVETTQQIGAPELPVLRFYVEDPNTSVTLSNPIEQRVRRSIQPVQAPVLKKPLADSAFELAESIYQADSYWPKERFTTEPAGSIRGKERWLLTVYPVRYNPVQKSLLVSDFIEIRESRSKVKANPNPEAIVFVVGPSFKSNSALSAYMQLKNDQGYDIHSIDAEGLSSQEIRSAIQTLYNDPSIHLAHALLVGDVNEVESHRSSIISGKTDHFYRAIDTSNYNSDINGPDIGVGRISVQTETQLEAVLDKLSRYQDQDFASTDWIGKASFLATDDLYEIAEGSHNYAIQNYTDPKGYLGIFPTARMAGGDQLYEITHRVPNSTVQQAIQEGRSIVNYSGHGGYYLWDAPRMTQSDVQNLSHPDAMPFVISNACITGDFTKPESFGETWQRHPNGAIFFWGSMDNTYWDEDDILEKRMYDGIFGTQANQSLTQFSDITQYALSELWLHYGGNNMSKYYWETYVSFGDPSVDLILH